MNWRRYLVLISAVASVAAGDTTTAQPTVSKSASDALLLQVNIPAFRLDVFQGQDRIQSFVVAVGSRRYSTPRGSFFIRQVTWDPWWYPPPQPWASHEKITPPGPSNPMGKVKLHLGRGFYLHGTPSVASIGSAASHGCVRMRNEDAIALAKLVQTAVGVPMSSRSIDSLVATWGETRTVDLPRPVAVRLAYEPVEVRNDSLLLHPDIYGLRKGTAESAALRVLAAYVSDTAHIDHSILRSLLRRAHTQHVSTPLSQLYPNVAWQQVVVRYPAFRADTREENAHTISQGNADCGGNDPHTSSR